MDAKVPAYFDALIDGFHRGLTNRFVHLGHWDEPPDWSPEARPAPQEFLDAQVRLNQTLLDMAGLVDRQSVLDIGCGFGGTLDVIDRTHTGMRLVGLNIDPRQIEICRRLTPRPANRLAWVAGDAAALPFAAASFDRIFCIEAMFHFASRQAFFAQAARVLGPGGVMVVSDIFLTEAAKALRTSARSIDTAIADAYGPWPDFWGAEDDHRALAGAAGLACTGYRNATAETAPSHRFTAPSDASRGGGQGNAMARAAIALRWLHLEGHLVCAYMRFEKEGTPV